MDRTTYDVFLSHNGKDKPTVERIALNPRESGLTPWLDTWQLVSSGCWQHELAGGMRASRARVVCVGANRMTRVPSCRHRSSEGDVTTQTTGARHIVRTCYLRNRPIARSEGP